MIPTFAGQVTSALSIRPLLSPPRGIEWPLKTGVKKAAGIASVAAFLAQEKTQCVRKVVRVVQPIFSRWMEIDQTKGVK